MKRFFHKRITIVTLLIITSVSLCSCSDGSSSSEVSSDDLRTYSFVVDYYDDIHQKVGYDYVAYNEPSRVVRKIDSNPSYDYKPHNSVAPDAGVRYVFDSWKGNYGKINSSLPPYSEKKPVPDEGTPVDIHHIKGPCSLYATFKEETISYQTRFYNENQLMKEGDALYDENTNHSWGDFVTLPPEPSKVSRYGYKNDFLGYGFKANGKSVSPFRSLASASFYSGEGKPTEVASFTDVNGQITSTSVAPGSFYEDRSTKDEQGYYTLDLYGFDGEWNFLASLASGNPKISYYANYADDKEMVYDVEIFRSYEDFKGKSANPIQTVGASFATQIGFSSDQRILTFTEDGVKTNVTLAESDLPMKKIRKWMGVFADDESIIEQYRGKFLSDDNYVFAPVSLFPISADCTMTVLDSFGEEKGSLSIAYGNKFRIEEATKIIVAKDAEGNTNSLSIDWNDGEWKAYYSSSDVSLPDSMKGKELLLDDAVIGDIILQAM